MDIRFNGFIWHVHPGAYAWGTGAVFGDEDRYGGSPPPALSTGYYPAPGAAPLRRYSPLVDQTGLFLLFAETNPTQRGIFDFVNRFGMLLSARVTQELKGRPRGRAAGDAVVGVLVPHGERLEDSRGDHDHTAHHCCVAAASREAVRRASPPHSLVRRWRRSEDGNLRQPPELPEGVAAPSPRSAFASLLPTAEMAPPGLPGSAWMIPGCLQRFGWGI